MVLKQYGRTLMLHFSKAHWAQVACRTVSRGWEHGFSALVWVPSAISDVRDLV